MARRTIIGASGGGGGSALQVRDVADLTTESLDAAEVLKTTMPGLPVGYRLYTIQTSRPARIRFYTSSSAQDDDEEREIGVDPAGDAGVLLDYVTEDTAAHTLSPLVDGVNLNDDPPTEDVPVTITNLDDGAGTVVLTVVYLRTE